MPGPLHSKELVSLCRCSLNKTIATADRRNFQVQTRVFGMAALVHDLQIRLMAAPDSDQHIGLVMFSEMGAKAALSVVNRFHVPPPVAMHQKRSFLP